MYDYDVIVIGSGFGGSVSALRLTEKGYKVAVLEAGRRYTPETLPKNSWDLRSYLWAPKLGLYGIQRIHLMSNVMILAGAGVGGGSLNYANTLYVPPEPFFRDRQWGHITDWQQELAPYYEQAQRMLGARLTPAMTPSDVELKAAAERMGCGDTFHMAPVGVFYGDGNDADGVKAGPGEEVPDPFFGGAGPSRKACMECGECMTGCRRGAKNTLTENYLYLAEQAGAVIKPMTTVSEVAEHPDGGYTVTTVPTDKRKRGKRTTLRAEKVVVAAGTYGTQTLLHTMRDTGRLPRLSAKLGELTRTNSEALTGAFTFPRGWRKLRGKDEQLDFTRGVAITSSIHPNESTHIEPVRYGKGSNLMALMCIPGYHKRKTAAGRALSGIFRGYLRHPLAVLRILGSNKWSERTIIALVMQTKDNSLNTSRKKRGLFGKGLLTAEQGHGEPNPVHIPEGATAAQELADAIGGVAGTNIGEIMNSPLTAHFLGGCPISDSADGGVIDPYHRVWGHPGISVVDGSAVSANLGVNPSLTITAQAERAMSLWPNKGEADGRPEQGAAYERLAAVEPVRPTVPKEAYGALRLPVLPVPKVPAKKSSLSAEAEAKSSPAGA
ncbi:GMC family oxidoreductase [Streptomyces sp. A7024]|uniref:Cholesterol oxidase n=1 Tax=Streptomyces coryli TaxID=1128680 RepID=A0A6G4U5E5_9ACTN|nr:GMC family oxidoreductase [Streptomyces coryli]